MRPQELFVQTIISNVLVGGRWQFPVELNATTPLIDDTIIIEGNINKVSMVSFKLHNRSSDKKPFRAFFTDDSPAEFAVSPDSGYMIPDTESQNDADNQFIISYKPSTYGKTHVGTLIIEVFIKDAVSNTSIRLTMLIILRI